VVRGGRPDVEEPTGASSVRPSASSATPSEVVIVFGYPCRRSGRRYERRRRAAGVPVIDTRSCRTDTTVTSKVPTVVGLNRADGTRQSVRRVLFGPPGPSASLTPPRAWAGVSWR